MEYKHNKKLVPTARMLRKSMTKEEKHLWYDYLRDYPIRFSRQKIIGKYIVDFYCPKANLVIELDGSQHYSEKGLYEDGERTKFLQTYGIKVVRIKNERINKNFNAVCRYINDEVEKNLKLSQEN